MKDSEFEAILRQALADNTEVPKELNEKLMRKISARKKVRYFPVNGLKYAAAAAVVAVGVGALVNGGYFSDKKGNDKSNIALTDKISVNDSSKINPDNSEKPTEAPEVKTAEADTEQKQNSTSSAAEIKSENIKTNKNAESGKSTAGTKKRSQNPTAKQSDTAYSIAYTGKPVQNEKEADIKADTESVSAADTDGSGYKYLEIAADGIGKALESLNIMANDYIDGHYTAYIASAKGSADTVMFSMASGAAAVNDAGADSENTAVQQSESVTDYVSNMRSMKMSLEAAEDSAADMPEVKASYEVMADTDNYYSVRVDAVADVGFIDELSNHYTVDKNKESVVTLDDIYSDVPEYKERLYDNISSQMKQRMKEDENVQYYIGNGGFTSISGNEDFYMNDREEVVITYERGIVAPYSQGESVFNVGRTDELNNK